MAQQAYLLADKKLYLNNYMKNCTSWINLWILLTSDLNLKILNKLCINTLPQSQQAYLKSVTAL